MAKKVAVVVIHGMGSQNAEFAEPMIKEINTRVKKLAKKPSSIIWKTIYWADLTETRQLEYYRRARRDHALDFIRLRKFVLTALGDVAAYQNIKGKDSTTYKKIHARIKERINDLYVSDCSGKACPLIILAHSLGGHIMSNYIWDHQQGHDNDSNDFENMEYHAGFITFGCNLPLFTFAFNKVVPIRFPGKKLNKTQKKKARWLNYFDPDDVLAYPLRSINSSYKKTVHEDIAINAGNILTSWNPMAHSGYWTDNDFTRPVAKFIAQFI